MVEIFRIIKALDRDDVEHFADINAQSPELAIALYHRFGTQIHVLYLGPKGRYRTLPDDVRQAYFEQLTKAGVPDSSIHFDNRPAKGATYCVVGMFDSFGVRYNIKALSGVLEPILAPDSRIVATISKGSGAYPFLNTLGGCNTLEVPTTETVGLAVVSVEPQSGPQGSWSEIANDLAKDGGFFRDLGDHSFLYVPRGDTLVVTFDNLDIAMTKREDRRPWGYNFIEAQGWSILGVMANGWTWFKDKSVTDEFDRLRDSGFFSQFKRVVFYGASMGGYAAATYSAAAPGSTVFVISPQSTLDKQLVPWEMRYKKAWSRDFSDHYGDAAKSSQKAETVNIIFDPFVEPDAKHAARFDAGNVRLWPCPLMGHRLGSSLAQMGILSEITIKTIDGSIDRHTFYKLLRKRREFPRYLRELANQAMEKKRPTLALIVVDHAQKIQNSAYFRNLKAQLNSD